MMTETALEPVGVGVSPDTCTFETQQAVVRTETQGIPGRHLPRHPGGEGVAPRFLPTGRKALRCNKTSLAIEHERVRGSQRQSWRHPEATAPYEVLRLERVVGARLLRVQCGGE